MSMIYAATCIAIDGRAILIEGPPGSGKSSLALMLMDRGAALIGDDSVTLRVEAAQVLASPPPNIRGLLEVRNVGLISQPVLEHAPVALMITLDPEAPRFIETAERMHILGHTIPRVRLWPDSPALHLRAEIALREYGLV